jgi:hypothetical protein
MPYGYLGKVRQFHAFVPAQVRASVYICVQVRVHVLISVCVNFSMTPLYEY